MGMGVVGSAVAASLKGAELLVTYDKYRYERSLGLQNLRYTEFCFICVPTPTTSGRQDLTAIIECLEQLDRLGYRGVVVIKSTVLPGSTQLLANRFFAIPLVHYPEFLSERSANQDYLDQKTVLLSGKKEDRALVHKLLEASLGRSLEAMESDMFEATEFAKYIHNCALAIQLSFLNEMRELIGSQELYDQSARMAHRFGNINQYFRVPGPDGRMGWGGKCFPKDTKALLSHAMRVGREMATLRGAVATNTRFRSDEML
jgi:UDPglucose 6-dehydrogenase